MGSNDSSIEAIKAGLAIATARLQAELASQPVSGVNNTSATMDLSAQLRSSSKPRQKLIPSQSLPVKQLIPNIMLRGQAETNELKNVLLELEEFLLGRHKSAGLALNIIPILYKDVAAEYEVELSDLPTRKGREEKVIPIRLYIISNGKVDNISGEIEADLRKNNAYKNTAIASHIIDTSKNLSSQVDKIEGAINAEFFNHFINKLMIGDDKENAQHLSTCYFASLRNHGVSNRNTNLGNKLNKSVSALFGKEVLFYQFHKCDVVTGEPVALTREDKMFFQGAAQYWMNIFKSATFVQDESLSLPPSLQSRCPIGINMDKSPCVWDFVKGRGHSANTQESTSPNPALPSPVIA